MWIPDWLQRLLVGGSKSLYLPRFGLCQVRHPCHKISTNKVTLSKKCWSGSYKCTVYHVPWQGNVNHAPFLRKRKATTNGFQQWYQRQTTDDLGCMQHTGHIIMGCQNLRRAVRVILCCILIMIRIMYHPQAIAYKQVSTVHLNQNESHKLWSVLSLSNDEWSAS